MEWIRIIISCIFFAALILKGVAIYVKKRGEITEDSTVREVIHEAASKAVESKAVAASVAAGTAALGFKEMQSYAQLFATIAAGILSLVLIFKHGYDVYKVWKAGKDEDSKKD